MVRNVQVCTKKPMDRKREKRMRKRVECGILSETRDRLMPQSKEKEKREQHPLTHDSPELDQDVA